MSGCLAPASRPRVTGCLVPANNASRSSGLHGFNGQMQIERFDPDADAGRVLACHLAYLAGAPVDEPYCPPMSLPAFTGWLACGWTADPPEVWFAGDSPDQADGWYMAELPQRENRHLSYIHPLVNPASRRTGIGTLLLRHAAARAA